MSVQTDETHRSRARAQDAARVLGELRRRGPLVACSTNIVVTGFTANVLLAVGASPAMVEHPGEAARLLGAVMPAGTEALGTSRFNYFGAGARLLRRMMRQRQIASLEELIALREELGIRMIACYTGLENAEAAKAMEGTPMHQSFMSISPNPERWADVVTRMGKLIGQDYDWSAGVSTLKMPTLIVFADHDSVRPIHAVEFFQLLGGGQRDAGWDGSGMSSARLAILPGTTHYNIFSAPMLASTWARRVVGTCTKGMPRR